MLSTAPLFVLLLYLQKNNKGCILHPLLLINYAPCAAAHAPVIAKANQP